MPGVFRPLVYRQPEEPQLTDAPHENTLAGQHVPIPTRTPFYALSDEAERNLASLNANGQSQKYHSSVRPISQIIQLVAAKPLATMPQHVSEQRPFGLQVKPLYKNSHKPKFHHIEDNEHIRPSVSIAATEATAFQRTHQSPANNENLYLNAK